MRTPKLFISNFYTIPFRRKQEILKFYAVNWLFNEWTPFSWSKACNAQEVSKAYEIPWNNGTVILQFSCKVDDTVLVDYSLYVHLRKKSFSQFNYKRNMNDWSCHWVARTEAGS